MSHVIKNKCIDLQLVDEKKNQTSTKPIPVVALGTWNAEPGVVGKVVKHAIEDLGYRHLDCAANYLNEVEIGDALTDLFQRNVVKRSDLFITSKLNNPYHQAKDVKDHLLKSLKDLNLEYLDLWLMHWPFAYAFLPYDKNTRGYDKDYDPVDLKGVDLSAHISPTKGGKQFAKVPIQETWHAMEECYRQGLVKSIGVANFTGALVYDMLTYAQIKPAVIQIECHPYLQQASLVKFCQREGLVVEAYSPLGTPGFSQQKKNEPLVLGDPVICKIADSHSKTPAQICLRWQIQRGVVVLPKSVTSDRLKQNIDVFGFELSEDEMNQISTIDKRHHFLNPDQWFGIPLFD